MDTDEIAEEYEKEEGYEDVVRMLREDARRVGAGFGARNRCKGVSKPVTTRTNTRFLGNLLRSQDRHNQRVERVQKTTNRRLEMESTRFGEREKSGEHDKRQGGYSSHHDRLIGKGKELPDPGHNLDQPEPRKPKKPKGPIVTDDKTKQRPRGHHSSSRPTINNEELRESLGGS
uniref:ARAD1C42658p n=1 Tax=Blastobotrys adeninivorans TaxID=409370 RepID=A0A060T485_BLAAD